MGAEKRTCIADGNVVVLCWLLTIVVSRLSVKWRGGVPPQVSIPPLWGGDFQGIRVYRSDAVWERARKASLRARHRLDEPTGLSLGTGASLQSRLPFHLATSL